jgi:hypothetical protein
MNIREPKQEQPPGLLDTIRLIWGKVGNTLSDTELTFFLQKAELPVEAGFAFLSFACGHVTLTVPKQNPEYWYANKGWITPDKEKVAKNLAQKYGLLLNEPFDDSLVLYPELASPVAHHHLALSDHRQTVIVAHPLFLKICLFGKSADSTYRREPRSPLPLGPELLQDISPLYHCEPNLNCPAKSTLARVAGDASLSAAIIGWYPYGELRLGKLWRGCQSGRDAKLIVRSQTFDSRAAGGNSSIVSTKFIDPEGVCRPSRDRCLDAGGLAEESGGQ